MDRQIVYRGATPLTVDILNTNKNTLVAISKLAEAVLGTTTTVSGLVCTPVASSLNVTVGPGSIYSMRPMDATDYAVVVADSAHVILKQGIVLDSTTLTPTAPTPTGQSVNYLVQAILTETDTDNTVLNYYNPNNPGNPYSGPSNSGQAQPTTRKSLCVVSLVAGIAATTGSQTTPAPAAGAVGLWVVTVANGQTAVTPSNITKAAGAPFVSPSGPGGYDSAAAASISTSITSLSTRISTASASSYDSTTSASVSTAVISLSTRINSASGGGSAPTDTSSLSTAVVSLSTLDSSLSTAVISLSTRINSAGTGGGGTTSGGYDATTSGSVSTAINSLSTAVAGASSGGSSSVATNSLSTQISSLSTSLSSTVGTENTQVASLSSAVAAIPPALTVIHVANFPSTSDTGVATPAYVALAAAAARSSGWYFRAQI